MAKWCALCHEERGFPSVLAPVHKLDEDKEVITYCRTGMLSSHSYLALKLLGYPRVRSYNAAMIEWGNRPDLPMEK